MNRKKHEEQKDGILEPVAPTPSVSEEDGDSSDSTDRELRQIVETGSITVDKRGHYIHCLTVIGQIEGHYVLPAQNKTTKYEHVIPQLVAIEESRDIEGLLIILNTVGGDIEAGLAIAELIAGMNADRVPRPRRRTFDRRAARGFERVFFYRAERHHDCPPGQNDGTCPGRAADYVLF